MNKSNIDPKDSTTLRKKALERLKKSRGKATGIASDTEILKLIHELEVHQVELEMQNEELLIAKEIAEKAEEKYTNLFDFAPSAYFNLTSEGVISELNLEGSKMLGTERQLLINKHLDLFIKNDYRPVFNDFLVEIFTDNKRKSCEVQFISSDNITKCAQLNGAHVDDEKTCMISARDITDQKRDELLIKAKIVEIDKQNKELNRSNNRLLAARKKAEDSEGKFRSLFNKVNDAIFFYDDKTFEILEANNATSELYGYSREELIGMSCMLFSAEVEESKLAAKEISAKEELVVNFRHHKRKDGTDLFVQLQGYKVVLNNKPVAFVLSHDITESVKTELELRAAKEKAEESERLKSAFLANMSHEIRTPMNGILGFAELLKRKDLKGSEQKKYIGIIEKSGKRMLNIINDIVDISKIEAGLMSVNIKESNINDQIKYLYTFFKPETDSKEIKLSYKTPLNRMDALIKTDREKMFAIFTNLVKNAIKFTDQGSIEFGYKPVTGSEQKELVFYVKDTGIGIPVDRQKAIFDRFIQADIADKMAYQGSGLGLAISKAYVEMLGGKMWVESKIGEGSTFYFTTPYETNFVNIPKDSKNIEEEGKVDFRKIVALIVEDDEISEMLIDAYINPFSNKIFKARNGKSAVEMCRDNPDINLIMMDIRLPDMGGYKATEQIRYFNKDVIIVAQTAYAYQEDKEKAKLAGCNDFLVKPIVKKELLTVLEKYFGK